MPNSGIGPNKPAPPYWAVIFTNQRTQTDEQGYQATAKRMAELALSQPGCLGYVSTRDAQGFGVTVSYWQNEASIKVWRDHPEHQKAQTLGREKWYSCFDLQVAHVVRTYAFEKEHESP